MLKSGDNDVYGLVTLFGFSAEELLEVAQGEPARIRIDDRLRHDLEERIDHEEQIQGKDREAGYDPEIETFLPYHQNPPIR